MVLMCDANILIDHLGKREPYYETSRLVCLLGIAGYEKLFFTTSMVTDIHYILRKDYGSIEAQRMIAEDLDFINMVAVTPEDVSYALSKRWNDFEDCLVAECAHKINADYIITRNCSDFDRSSVKALTPEQFFEEMRSRGIDYEDIEWN